MEEKDLFKKINEESENHVPDVYDKILFAAHAEGLFDKEDNTAVYSDGETVALGGVNKKAIAITTLAAIAAVSLAIALPVALSGKYDSGLPIVPPVINDGDKIVADMKLGDDYAIGAVATAKLSEIYLVEEGEAYSHTPSVKPASLVVNPDEAGIEKYISEFDNYFYACNSFFGEKPVDVEYVENHNSKYDNSIVIYGDFSNGDKAFYAMYYSEARILQDDTVTGDEVKYYLEGYICLNSKDYYMVGERVYQDATKEKVTSLSLKAYPVKNFTKSCVEMSLEYNADGSIKKYDFKVIKNEEVISESVLSFPTETENGPAYYLEFNGDDGERIGQFTVNRPENGFDSLLIGYELGGLTSEFRVHVTNNTIERVLAPDGFEYADLGDGTYQITGFDKYKKLPEELVIPSEFEGKKVVKIGSSAFKERSDIVRVIIPDGVKLIAGQAFYKCANLTNVLLPDSVTDIDYLAFYGCTALKSIDLPANLIKLGSQAVGLCSGIENIVIPDKVESLGRGCFENCRGLKSVTIPASLKTVDEGIFGGTALKSITVDSANENFYVEGGCFIEKATKTVLGGCVGFEVPNGIEAIGRSAFYSCQFFTEVTLPSSVKEIKSLAFSYTLLESIVMPNVETIASSAFSNCLFKNLNLPDKLKTIDSNAFYQCTNLISIHFPASLTTMGGYVFSGCHALENITVDAANTVFRSENNCLIDRRTNSVIRGGINSEIPSSVTSFEAEAFAHSNLKSIVIPDNVWYIGPSAFSSCLNLESVVFSTRLTYIEAYAFKGCTLLKSVTLPEGLKRIWTGAFQGCSTLNSVVLSSTATEIDENIFAECFSLASIVIPEGQNTIAQGFLYNCKNLESITISHSVQSIESQAFYGCTKLKEINYAGTMQEWQEIQKEDGNWNWDTGAYVVKCTDGTLDKYGNVIN